MANIGLAFVNPAPLTKPAYVVNFAKKCEAMGVHSMWTIDRVAYDNLDSMTLLAAAAGATQRIRIGTSVLLPGLRHPALLAKTIATLDFVSNGRVTIGVGFGIKDAESARAVADIADAVIIGSRIVQEIESAGPDQAVARVKALIEPIRKALDAPVRVQDTA